MDGAVVALQNLARQCSDPAAVEALGKHLFAILGGEETTVFPFFSLAFIANYKINQLCISGSEGKLTAVAQKISVLSGNDNFTVLHVSNIR